MIEFVIGGVLTNVTDVVEIDLEEIEEIIRIIVLIADQNKVGDLDLQMY